MPVEDGSCPPRTDSTAMRWWVACLPDDFNAHVASRRPDRIDVVTADGRSVSGPSILVRNDTAHVGARSVPMNRVDHLYVSDPRDQSQRLLTSAAVVGFTAGAGAGIGALSGNDAVSRGDASLRGLGAGAVVGLAFAAMGQRTSGGERFEVVGWVDAESAPQRRSLLSLESDNEVPSWGSDVACGHPLPPGVVWVDRCEDANTLTTRAGAYWVDAVEVHLRAGGHLRGRDLTVTESEVVLDGIRQSWSEVSRIELTAPYGPFRVIRPVAKGALTGAAYGLLFGAASWIGSGDSDGLWIGSVIGGGLGAASGLTLGLGRGRDRVRDVTYLPDSGP